MHRDGGWAVCSWWTSSEAVQLWEEALGSFDELATCHHVPVLWHFRAGGHRGARDQRAASGHGQDDAFLSSLYWRSVYLSLQGRAWILQMGIDHWSGNLKLAWELGVSLPETRQKDHKEISLGPPYAARLYLQPRSWSCVIDVYLCFPTWRRQKFYWNSSKSLLE